MLDFENYEACLDPVLKEFKKVDPENLVQRAKATSLILLQRVLSSCCKYFLELTKHTEVTLMTPENIGTSIGPSILVSPKIRQDPMAFVSASSYGPPMLGFIVRHQDQLFSA